MTAPAQQPTTVDLLVVLTRLETKLDTVTTGMADHETRLRQLEQAAVTTTDLKPMRDDVEALKRNRWPLPSLAALVGLAALIVAIWQPATGR